MVRCSLAALHMVMMVATDTPHTPPANISQGQVGSHHPSRCGHSVTHTAADHGGKYIGSSSVSCQTNHLRGISTRITQDGSFSRANTARKSTRIQVRDIILVFETLYLNLFYIAMSYVTSLDEVNFALFHNKFYFANIKIESWTRKYCRRLLNIVLPGKFTIHSTQEINRKAVMCLIKK